MWYGATAFTSPGITFANLLEAMRSGQMGFEIDLNYWFTRDAKDFGDSRFYGDMTGGGFNQPPEWGDYFPPSGGQSMPYRIKGFCKDAGGNPLGYVDLYVYKADSKELLYSVTYGPSKDSPTDPGTGYFCLCVPDNTNYYFVLARRAGSPDLAGGTGALLGEAP